MIFGPTALAEAEGAVLAHTHRVPGRVLKKGAVLDASAIDGLRAAGLDPVVAARMEPGDVGEDAAARRVATALLGPGLTLTRAATGRVNLVAASAGLLRADRQLIDALNAVDEAVTVATLPDASPVAAGEMVATIKIIPFAVPGATLDRAVSACAGGAMAVQAWRAQRIGLVLTTLPGLKASVIEGTVAATRARVLGVGGTLLPALQCPHRSDPIAAALRSLIEDGADLLLIAGASAVVDRRDVGPAGIVAAGGEILHFGMPVDPGNLICLGRIGTRAALVLPGCARSPKLNGIDWVLARLFAGLPLAGGELTRMGVGGLLKDVSPRPLPRAKAAPYQAKTVAAIVLAAGQSTRMAPHHKLLVTDRAGKPIIARTVDNVLASGARPVIVVTGHREAEIRAALGRRPVTIVKAVDHAAGLSASLRAGLAALPDVAAALVCLGDMPLVTGRMIDRLIETHDADEGRLIVAPTASGALGNPVLWDRRYFPELAALEGDRGARALLDGNPDAITTVELGEAALRDFDTPESLSLLR